jgi:hypothetical protein
MTFIAAQNIRQHTASLGAPCDPEIALFKGIIQRIALIANVPIPSLDRV